MAKKTTLNTLAAHLQKIDTRMEKMDARIERGFEAADNKFAALADDIVDLRTELKGGILTVQTQVNSIEQQLRETKTEARLGALEEKLFGSARR